MKNFAIDNVLDRSFDRFFEFCLACPRRTQRRLHARVDDGGSLDPRPKRFSHRLDPYECRVVGLLRTALVAVEVESVRDEKDRAIGVVKNGNVLSEEHA